MGAERLNDQVVARLGQERGLGRRRSRDLSETERGQKLSGHSLRAGLASSAEVDKTLCAEAAWPRLGRDETQISATA